MPRNPQARRKKTTRKSDRRELRAIFEIPSLRANIHPIYCTEYRQYIITFDGTGPVGLPSQIPYASDALAGVKVLRIWDFGRFAGRSPAGETRLTQMPS